jgi:arylsulfatase A
VHSRLPPLLPTIATLALLLLTGCARARDEHSDAASSLHRPPNIILIVSDDLGVGEVGCYGQTIIRTPSIDRLAGEGVRFTNAYSGSCVCAPARCTLLTGLHTGHAPIRDNRELSPTGQEPLPAESVTLAELLRRQGYATAAIGKWGLGAPGSVGDPKSQGFDHFFGYLCQRHAHNHCPSYLYRDGEVVSIPENKDVWPRGEIAVGARYAPDLFRDEAISFLRGHRDGPFFLLFATPVPHVALQVPDDSLNEYRGEIADAPYDGSKGYLKHESPHAAYAAMVTRMDRDIGDVLGELRALGLDENTIVLFTSDNGASYAGGTDSEFFHSAAGRRGLKGQLYEGGIRVPLIARWPCAIPAGRTCDLVTANWDLFPTLARAAGVSFATISERGPIDGIDLTPALTGTGACAERDHLYWEYAAGGGSQAVRQGDWKAVRRQAKKPGSSLELYDLASDPTESRDVAKDHPEVVRSLATIMNARTPSPIEDWNLTPAPLPPSPAGLIVVPTSLVAAAEAWANYRREQGWTIDLLPVAPGETAEAIRARIATWRAGLADGTTPTILLLGDVSGDVGDGGIPTFHFPQEEPALLRGGEPTFASDHPYGLLDDREKSLCAVGRVPASSPEEALSLLSKIRAYETNAPLGAWRRNLRYVAGEGHFGAFDAVLEQAFLRFVDEMVPPAFDLQATYAKPDSLWCPPPEAVEQITLDELAQGSLLFNYIGHGHADGVDTMRWIENGKERRAPILRGASLANLASCESRNPIALMSCCSTGWFDREPKDGHERDSLAELFLFHPQGPIATVAGTRPTHPYGNALFQKEFTRELLRAVTGASDTLGEVDRRARREMLITDEHDRALDLIALPIAKMTDWKLSLAELRLMHVRMYALIGDPMMRIASAGERIDELSVSEGLLRGTVPALVSGTVEVSVETSRTECAATDLKTPAAGDDVSARAHHNYERIQRRVLWRGEATITDGRFTCALPSPMPDRAAILRVTASGRDGRGQTLEAFGGIRMERTPPTH